MCFALIVRINSPVGPPHHLAFLFAFGVRVFLIEKLGFHRELGTHITKVKSISLDTWTDPQLKLYENISKPKVTYK